MAIQLLRVNKITNVPNKGFVCDSLVDLNQINTSILNLGDEAHVINDGSEWVYNGSSWIQTNDSE